MKETALVLVVALTAIAAVLGLIVVITGMTGRWRGNRAGYYTRPTVLSLMGLFAGVGAALYSRGYTKFAWAAVAVAGWILLEALFAVFKSSSVGDRVFTEPAAQDGDVELQGTPAAGVASPTRPVRRNPTPHGPAPKRHHR